MGKEKNPVIHITLQMEACKQITNPSDREDLA